MNIYVMRFTLYPHVKTIPKYKSSIPFFLFYFIQVGPVSQWRYGLLCPGLFGILGTNLFKKNHFLLLHQRWIWAYGPSMTSNESLPCRVWPPLMQHNCHGFCLFLRVGSRLRVCVFSVYFRQVFVPLTATSAIFGWLNVWTLFVVSIFFIHKVLSIV